MYGIDYEDTFAPTVKFDTLRVFLALVALEDLECHQVDVNNAFTESFLKETTIWHHLRSYNYPWLCATHSAQFIWSEASCQRLA
jgi:hypothetical protein